MVRASLHQGLPGASQQDALRVVSQAPKSLAELAVAHVGHTNELLELANRVGLDTAHLVEPDSQALSKNRVTSHSTFLLVVRYLPSPGTEVLN